MDSKKWSAHQVPDPKVAEALARLGAKRLGYPDKQEPLIDLDPVQEQWVRVLMYLIDLKRKVDEEKIDFCKRMHKTILEYMDTNQTHLE